MNTIILIAFIGLVAYYFTGRDLVLSCAGAQLSGAISRKQLPYLFFVFISLGFLISMPLGWSENLIVAQHPAFVVGITVLSSLFALLLTYRNGFLGSLLYVLYGCYAGIDYFSGVPLSDLPLLPCLLSWIVAPMLAVFVAYLFDKILHYWVLKQKTHFILLNVYLQIAILVISLLAFVAIGANSGPVLLWPLYTVNPFSTPYALWGILIIAVTLLSLSKRRIRKGIAHTFLSELNMEQILVQVITLTVVLTLFCLPILNRVAVAPIGISCTHVILGAFWGISLSRKKSISKTGNLLRLGSSIFIAPLISFLFSYISLRWLQLAGWINLSTDKEVPQHQILIQLSALLFALLCGALLLWGYLRYREQQLQQKRMSYALQAEQKERLEAQQELKALEVRSIQLENNNLNVRLDLRRKELMNMALNIREQREYFNSICSEIRDIQLLEQSDEMKKELTRLVNAINEKMIFSVEMNCFYTQVEELHKNFINKLMSRCSDLTEQEKRLCTLLRLGFSSKEIAVLLNITPKSVEINRYRFRKKLNLSREENLMEYIKSL